MLRLKFLKNCLCIINSFQNCHKHQIRTGICPWKNVRYVTDPTVVSTWGVSTLLPPPTHAHLGGWFGNICKLFNQCVPISNQSTQEFVSTPIFYLSALSINYQREEKNRCSLVLQLTFLSFSWSLVPQLISCLSANL